MVNHIYSPVDGMLYPITEVKDEVFSKKMIGDGFAVKPVNNLVYAPADGVLSMIFPTGHAFGLDTIGGIKLLIHIGIETVNENGEGFEILKNEGDQVRKGEPVIKMDLERLNQKYDTSVIVVIINGNEFADIKIDTSCQLSEPIIKYQ